MLKLSMNQQLFGVMKPLGFVQIIQKRYNIIVEYYVIILQRFVDLYHLNKKRNIVHIGEFDQVGSYKTKFFFKKKTQKCFLQTFYW